MIQGINANQQYSVTATAKSANQSEIKKTTKGSQTGQSTKVDSIEVGTKQKTSVTYSKTASKKLDASEIATLKAEADKATENLRKLVEELILKQNKNYKASAGDFSGDAAGIAAQDAATAQQAISEDGNFGVKAVSDRLVDFAIAVSGGDKSKFSELVSAIDQGFSQAKHALGGELPDICQQTYDETMRKLDEWASETDS